MKRLTNWLQKIVTIKPEEIKVTFAAFALVFLLMACYFILRPVRDAMASEWSDMELSFLWNINFFVSTGFVACYGYVVSRLKFRNVVPIVYTFFALSFVVFYFAVSIVAERDLVDKIFYIWVSVFSLFHVSVFWSFMANTFTKEQAKRLFAIITTGASAGALVGPAIPALLPGVVAVDKLMLIAACGLMLVIPLIYYIDRLKYTALRNHHINLKLKVTRLDRAWWSGFHSIISNPYLLSIAIFILLYVFIGSFVYFEQKNLLADFTRNERIQILGSIDWLVNSLTFSLAFFATGHIVNRFGMPTTLAIIPLCVVVGLVILAFAPVVSVLLALQVARRSGNYAITRPAREMLYTEVTDDERFKAKPVVDIVVYRAGDAIGGSVFAFLTEVLSFRYVIVAIIGAVIALLWAWLGLILGWRYDAKGSKS